MQNENKKLRMTKNIAMLVMTTGAAISFLGCNENSPSGDQNFSYTNRHGVVVFPYRAGYYGSGRVSPENGIAPSAKYSHSASPSPSHHVAPSPSVSRGGFGSTGRAFAGGLGA